MIDLTDKVAIVTGGASGIGRGLCLVLAEQGAHIVVADVSDKGAESVTSEVSAMGRQALAIRTDVADRASVNSMVDQVIDKFGQIDILVNDAGVMGAPDWDRESTPTDEDWDWALAINLRGVVNVSEAVAPYMKERCYGKILNVLSGAARVGDAGSAQYSASKAAALSFTQSNALQLAPYNINVNAICPGLVWTAMTQPGAEARAAPQGITGRELFESIWASTNPMKRPQTPEDMGNLTAFLASDDACNITGQAINIDGGARLD